MPYIQRDTGGLIASISAVADTEHEEYLSATSQEIVDFLSANNQPHSARFALEESDRELARITEDLVQVLIRKNIILFTDLPNAVQQKLLNREKLRAHLNKNEVSFLDDGGSI